MSLWLRAVLTATIVASAFTLTTHSLAQEETTDGPASRPSDRPGNSATPDDSANDDATKDQVREQTIYVPYEKLEKVFEQHGRGVFLPYEKFQELWKSARAKRDAPDPKTPPLDAVITEIESQANVGKDVVEVKAVVKIEVLTEGWKEIPLRLADAAITKAIMDGQPARIIGDGKRGYRLLYEKKGEEPKQIELALEYAKAIEKAPGRNRVSFQAPQAPVSRWRVQIPQSGVEVDIQPMIAASEVPVERAESNDAPPPGADPVSPDPASTEPADAGDNANAPTEQTVLLAFVGAAPTVQIEWTPKAEGAVGLKAVASVQSRQQIFIDEGVTRTVTQLDYKISRAELAKLKIEVPTGHEVANVLDANVRQWSVQAEADRQVITADLFEPAGQSQQVTVELKHFTENSSPDGDPAPEAGRWQNTIQAPVVKALDVDRQQGVLLVQVDPGLRAEATKRAGLLQVDASEQPQPPDGGQWDFAYRYAGIAVPFDLQLRVEKVEPRIRVDSLVAVYLEPQRLSLDLSAVYTIERAGVFQLQVDVPAGFQVLRAYGQKIGNAAAVEVDSYHVVDDTRLLVDLSRKAMGQVALCVELRRELQEPDLLTPTGQTVAVGLPIPRIGGKLHEDTGRVVLYATESLELNLAKDQGVREISPQQAGVPAESLRQKPADVQPVLARAFSQEPTELELSVKRLKPHVTVGQLLVAKIDSGVVKYEATFYYDVLYSGIQHLRIDVPKPPDGAPADEAAEWRNVSTDIRDVVAEPPDDLPEGYEAWHLTGKTELIGKGQIKLVCEQKIGELGAGKSVELKLPRLKPMEVDREWGQIVLTKAETIDVTEKEPPASLLMIDPDQELMAPVDEAARAFEFYDDWDLTVVATQYELVELKRTGIERAVIRMVVTRSEEVSVQALYRVRSARQQLELKLPEGAEVDMQSLRLNGRQSSLQTNDARDAYFVRLVDQSAEKPFLLELRYTAPLGDGRLDLPDFPEQPAVHKVHLCVYLPHEWALLGTVGKWSEDFDWVVDGSGQWQPNSQVDPHGLIGRVCSGISGLGSNPAESFETDGQLYVFSTLRPAPLQAGSLKLKTVPESGLNAIVFGLVLFMGLVLVRLGIGDRALAIGVLIVALILCSVFFPTFARQVLGSVMAAAMITVLVVWLVWYVVRTRPQLVALREQSIAGMQQHTRASTPLPAEGFTTPSDRGHELPSGPASGSSAESSSGSSSPPGEAPSESTSRPADDPSPGHQSTGDQPPTDDDHGDDTDDTDRDAKREGGPSDV